MSVKLLLVVLCGVVAVAVSEFRPYQCKAGICADTRGYDRIDVCGCTDFCHIDRDESLTISRDELYKLLIDCYVVSTSGVCDEEALMKFVMAYLPVCESEARGMYIRLAALDGDSSSVSVKDTDITYDFISQIAGGDNCRKRAVEAGESAEEACAKVAFGTLESYRQRQDPVSRDGYITYYHNAAYPNYKDETCDRPLPHAEVA